MMQDQQREKELEGMPDEEGWVTVGSTGRNKGIPRTEIQHTRVTAKEKRKRKQKVQFYLNFESIIYF